MRYRVYIMMNKLVNDAETKEEAEELAQADLASDIESWGIEDTVSEFVYKAVAEAPLD